MLNFYKGLALVLQWTARSITEKVSFYIGLLQLRFWLMNFSRRQTQMRVVCKDEVVRQVEVRYNYQVEDKASSVEGKIFSLQSFGST